MRTLPMLCLTTACAGPVADRAANDADTHADSGVVDDTRPWSRTLEPSTVLGVLRGRRHQRAVVHLHSPFSHDACDGRGWVDGTRDTACLADLREALCATRFDAAYVTDHPDHGSARDFDDLFHPDEDSTWVREGVVASGRRCDDGHTVWWRAGFEDALMPVGLSRHVDADPEVRHDLLNREDADAVAAMDAVSVGVFANHAELRTDEDLARLQDDGLLGMEAYNLHAAFAPDLRRAVGLDPLGWAGDAAPFLDREPGAEPDLFFLAVHARQAPNEARWDALSARGPMVGIAGTDAHQNVLDLAMTDGERADSYRRMLRWFSTMLLTEGDGPAAADDALASGRAFVAFEALGTPVGFDLRLEHDDGVVEMGGTGTPGELVVECPKLSPDSPRGPDAPELLVEVLKDGEVWQTTCGRWPVGEGVYRVRVDVIPHHLAPFLGSAAALGTRRYPWVMSNPVRVVNAGS